MRGLELLVSLEICIVELLRFLGRRRILLFVVFELHR